MFHCAASRRKRKRKAKKDDSETRVTHLANLDVRGILFVFQITLDCEGRSSIGFSLNFFSSLLPPTSCFSLAPVSGGTNFNIKRKKKKERKKISKSWLIWGMVFITDIKRARTVQSKHRETSAKESVELGERVDKETKKKLYLKLSSKAKSLCLKKEKLLLQLPSNFSFPLFYSHFCFFSISFRWKYIEKRNYLPLSVFSPTPQLVSSLNYFQQLLCMSWAFV